LVKPESEPTALVSAAGVNAAGSTLIFGKPSRLGQSDAHRLLMRNLVATGVSAAVELDSGNWAFPTSGENSWAASIRELQADFTLSPDLYREWTLAAFPWPTGGYDARRRIAGTQRNLSLKRPEWLPLSSGIPRGTLQFDLRDGLLRTSRCYGSGPLQVDRFLGRMRLRDGGIEINDAKLDSPGGAFQVMEPFLSTASWRSSSSTLISGYNITGTLEEPLVAPVMRSRRELN